MALGIGAGLHTSNLVSSSGVMKLYFTAAQSDSWSMFFQMPTGTYNTVGDHFKWTMEIRMEGDWDGTDPVYTRFNFGNSTQQEFFQYPVDTWHTITKTAEFGNGGNNTPRTTSSIDWPALGDNPGEGSALYIKNMVFLVTSNSEYDANGHTGDVLNRRLNFSNTNVTNTSDGVAVTAINYEWNNNKLIQLGCGTEFKILSVEGATRPQLTLGDDGP